jgi:hypothetical protein
LVAAAVSLGIFANGAGFALLPEVIAVDKLEAALFVFQQASRRFFCAITERAQNF